MKFIAETHKYNRSVMDIPRDKDNDDRKKASLEKAQSNGFGQKGVAGRPKRDATDLFIDKMAEGRMAELVEKTFDAWERGLNSDNDKLAVTTADKFTKAFYNPDKKIVVEGGEQNQVNFNILLHQDNLNEKEKLALMKFKSFLSKGAEDEQPIEVEGEVIEEE